MTVKISSLTKGLVAHFPLNSKSEKVGDTLISSWTNQDFDTFTTSGTDITSMVSGGNGDNCYSAISMTSGKNYRITFTASRAESHLYLVIANNTSLSIGGGRQVITTSVSSGLNVFDFTASSSYPYIGFNGTDAWSTIAITDFSIKEIQTADNTPTSNHGTVYGATQNTDDMSFDGSNDYALLPTTIINADSDKYWTVSAWIKPSQISGSTVYSFFGSNGASRNIELGIYNQELYFYTNLGATTRKKTTDSPINSTNWHHVVFVRNNNDVLTTYVDGVLDNTSTNAALTGGAIIANSSTFGALRRSNDSQSRYFSGSIKDVRIYNRTLSATEVKSLYDLKGQSGGILI